MSLRSIFVGPLGVRAGWRAVLFMAVFAIVVCRCSSAWVGSAEGSRWARDWRRWRPRDAS